MPDTSKPRRQSFKTHRPRKEMRFGAYILGSTLGEGEFGKVILGWRRDDKQPSQVAIKFIRRDTITKGSEREIKVRREINALKNLSHPNIIKLEDVCQNDKYIGIVLDYVSGGELFDYILQNRYLKDSLACRLFSQLVSGVYYMHSKGLVHRDLKLENLLLDKHKNVIITDFGFVNEFSTNNELMKTSCGSPCYAAPELVISNEPYEARKADVWSCGVILYAMLAGYLPFDDDPHNPDGDNISRLYQYITTTKLTFPGYVEPVPRDLLRRILVSNPKKRVSLKEVRSHQWLAPHAPFLSITPSEWDMNNNKGSKPPQPRSSSIPKNDYRRYSLIEPSTNRQTTDPLPPQTSSNHAIALPTSTSSTSINELPFKQTRGNHQRSNSVQSYASASLALQAVVDADEFRAQQKLQQEHQTPMSSSHSLYNVDKTRSGSSSPKISHNQQLHQHQGIPRSTTHTGITSLIDYKEQLSNYIIEESPVKRSADPLSSTQEVSTTQFIKPKVPVSDHKFSAPSNQKLPGPGGRKQRPTSYHPGLYTGSSFATSQQDITHAAASDPKFSRPFSRSESINSIASLNNSKNISLPSVDLASAEGAIITPRSPSVIPPGVIGPSERSESGAVKIGNNLETGEKLEEVQELPRDITLDSNSSQKKTNRYSAIMTAELVFDKIFGSSSADQVPTLDVNDKSKESTGNKKSKESISKMDSETTSVHSNIASNISTTTTRNTSYQCSSMEQRRTKSSNNNNKTKRFSFLSFYNGNSSQSDDIEMNIPKVSKKKVLEPSKDINIAIKERKPTAGNNRDSVITYTSFAPKKEPSTAKKVMDFFKRRSMRVG